MYKYERIIYWSDDDNAFIVEAPELPECMADGETVEEAIKNSETVIKEWIETTIERGLEVPEPKGRLLDTSEDDPIYQRYYIIFGSSLQALIVLAVIFIHFFRRMIPWANTKNEKTAGTQHL